jgi:hypothetical protein
MQWNYMMNGTTGPLTLCAVSDVPAGALFAFANFTGRFFQWSRHCITMACAAGLAVPRMCRKRHIS